MSEFSVFEFVVAFGAILIDIQLGRLVLSIWLDEDKAKIASFAFFLGQAAVVKDFGYDAIAGTLLGAALTWWLFFKREKAVG